MLGNEIARIISQGILTILGALVSYGVAVGVNYIKKKREILIKQIGINEHSENCKIAQNLYYVVEQQFKFIPQAGEQKRKEFDKLLVEKIPGITQEELDNFREAICGMINSEARNSQILAPPFDGTKDIADVVDINKMQENVIISQNKVSQ